MYQLGRIDVFTIFFLIKRSEIALLWFQTPFFGLLVKFHNLPRMKFVHFLKDIYVGSCASTFLPFIVWIEEMVDFMARCLTPIAFSSTQFHSGCWCHPFLYFNTASDFLFLFLISLVILTRFEKGKANVLTQFMVLKATSIFNSLMWKCHFLCTPLTSSSVQERAAQAGTLRGTCGSQRKLSPGRALFTLGSHSNKWGGKRVFNRCVTFWHLVMLLKGVAQLMTWTATSQTSY